MWGMAGIVCGPSRDKSADVRAMTAALAHRGPDAEGFFSDLARGVFLGHRRLSIIDPGARANQPMFSADGRLVVVFNGEIYNFVELRTELEGRGAPVRPPSD